MLHAQASPEEQAIADILFAKNSADVEKHLPEALQNALKTIDRSGREQILFKPFAIMKEKNLKISEGGRQVVAAFDVESPDAEIKHFELRTQRRISNGYEAVLVLGLVSPEKSWGDAQVWMKFDQGEWRVTQLTDPSGYGVIDLEDPETIATLVAAPLQSNELSALSSMRSLMNALQFYAEKYSEMPDRIETLAELHDADAGSDDEQLIDRELANTHKLSGYKFEYQRTSIDTYRISARPLEFGKTGKKSLFADESEVIHVTEEDRDATSDDPTFDARRWYRRRE
jgi:hypothetical protein